MSALDEILAEPCLIERVEGCVVVEPLRFIPVHHGEPSLSEASDAAIHAEFRARFVTARPADQSSAKAA